MVLVRSSLVAAVAVSLVCLAQACLGQASDYYTLILQGNVVMPDGSPPPKTAGIERVCSDIQGSAPGPITDKKGHYLWRMDLAPADTRSCFIRATVPGLISTQVDLDSLGLSDYRQGKVINLPNIVLSPRDGGAARFVSLIAEDEAPGKARAFYKAAIKALDAKDDAGGIMQLQLAVKAVPKFADGWNMLGALYERENMLMGARDALQHAIEANPKLASPYLRLARISNELGDFPAAAQNEDALLKIEPRLYPEIYLQQGITRFEQKNLAGAEESLKTALSMDPAHKLSRAEYVLGMIALAKGDVNGAKEQISKYMMLDPLTPDIERIQAQLDSLGKPDAPKLDITLERP